MRQVPDVPAPIGIAGDGRLARHFAHYLTLLGLPVRTWSRRAGPPDPREALAGCRTVLLLLRDAAIEPFVHSWPDLRATTLVHCSGSLRTDVAQCAHPLMTFGPDLYDLERYARIPFVLDAGGTPLGDLLPGLPNPSYAIPADDRPHYHALAVMAGNFSTLLWSHLFDTLAARWNIPASAGVPYLEQVTANLRVDHRTALTGPLARGDVRTIEANRAALERDRFRGVYAAFVEACADRR